MPLSPRKTSCKYVLTLKATIIWKIIMFNGLLIANPQSKFQAFPQSHPHFEWQLCSFLVDRCSDHKQANGTVHAHLARINKTPPPTADMAMGAYKFWGYRPLVDESSSNGATAGNRAVPGLFVTFPSGIPGMTATQLWAPPIVGPTGDIWIPNAELFNNAPVCTCTWWYSVLA